MTKPQTKPQNRKPAPTPALPDCDPLLVATFRDQQLVTVEHLHLHTRCGGPCAGTVNHLNPQDYW